MTYTLAQLLAKRSSQRTFSPTSLSDEFLAKIIAVQDKIPTPSNAKNIHIYLLNDKEKKQLQQEMKSGFEQMLSTWETKDLPKKLRNKIRTYFRYSLFMFDAPALFIVTSKPRKSFGNELLANHLIFEKETDEDAITAGIALGFMTLLAENENLKSCILTAPNNFLSPLTWKKNKIQGFFCCGIPNPR